MRSHAAIAIRLPKHSLTLAAALIVGWALQPSPASAQVIQRGIQGGVTGAIIGGIIGGGKGAGRGAAIGAVSASLPARSRPTTIDSAARITALLRRVAISSTTRSRRSCSSATIRVRRMASTASGRPRRSANINIPIGCPSMGALRLSCSII